MSSRAPRGFGPRCTVCGHFRSEHRASPYPDRRQWCIADVGDGTVCTCETFRAPDEAVAAWVAGRLARWALR